MLCLLNSCKDEKQPILVENLPVKTIIKEIPKKKIDPMITKDFVLGKFNYTKHDAFEKVIPNYQIASFLGITPESLSRVRRERIKK